MVTEMFCILPVSVSVPSLGDCDVVLGDDTLGEMGQGYTGASYSYYVLQLHACESTMISNKKV